MLAKPATYRRCNLEEQEHIDQGAVTGWAGQDILETLTGSPIKTWKQKEKRIPTLLALAAV